MIDTGVVWREPGFVVPATELDHGTSVLAYAFEPRARINVCRDRLQALGVPTGPWLQELKREYLAGNHRHVTVLPDGSRASVEQLKEQVLLSSPGEKLVYAIDLRRLNQKTPDLSSESMEYLKAVVDTTATHEKQIRLYLLHYT